MIATRDHRVGPPASRPCQPGAHRQVPPGTTSRVAQRRRGGSSRGIAAANLSSMATEIVGGEPGFVTSGGRPVLPRCGPAQLPSEESLTQPMGRVLDDAQRPIDEPRGPSELIVRGRCHQRAGRRILASPSPACVTPTAYEVERGDHRPRSRTVAAGRRWPELCDPAQEPLAGFRGMDLGVSPRSGASQAPDLGRSRWSEPASIR